MLLLLFLIGFGYAQKSVLIIGGDFSGAPITVEQFFPTNMTSRIIGEIEFHPTEDYGQPRTGVMSTPVNATHAFLLPRNNSHSYYIDTAGKLTPGPVLDGRTGPGLTSIPGNNGQMNPIYCGGKTKQRNPSKKCKVISFGQDNYFEPILDYRTGNWPSLTAFGKTLILIGGQTIERYNDTEWRWKRCTKPVPDDFNSHDSATVKLNETALLTCGGNWDWQKCYVYHVDKEEWTLAPEMKGSGYDAQMVLIDQTVYAFGGSHSGRSDIQTLNISGGIEKAQWKLWKDVLQKPRRNFGVWVIDSTPRSTTTGYTFSLIFLFLFLSIVAYFFIGVVYRHFVVGAHGMELLPNHSFWLKIYRRTHHLCATKFANIPWFVSSISVENRNYNRFADESNETQSAAPAQQAETE